MKTYRGLSVMLALLIALARPKSAGAVSASPGRIALTEPATGKRLSGYQVGDEFFSYCTDEQGMLLELDAEGYFRRVVREGDGYALGSCATGSQYGLSGREESVRRGDEDLREKLTAMREGLRAAAPMLLDEAGSSEGEGVCEQLSGGRTSGNMGAQLLHP